MAKLAALKVLSDAYNIKQYKALSYFNYCLKTQENDISERASYFSGICRQIWLLTQSENYLKWVEIFPI
jgi:hypothetical protein